MKFFQFLKPKKIFFFQVFLTLYIGINLIGGERGLISYFKKSAYEHKNKLLSVNIDFDYLDTLYRKKLKFGNKDEILIKIR